MDYSRGSEWRKWDLHLHSFHTTLNKNFGEDIDAYLNKIVEEKISVVGLTNYFNFSEQDYTLRGQLLNKGIQVFLNLELRLTYTNKDDDCLDLHIIFSDSVERNLIDTFLTKLNANIEGKTKILKDIAFKEERKTAVVEFNDIKDLINKDESLENLKNNTIIGFLSRGKGNSRTSSMYEKLSKECDFLIHSTDKVENVLEDREYWLCQSKPLLNSSDAHKIDDIGSKFTWIKADLTFEGLKQILCEPKDRVKIQANKPEEKSGYQVIDSIKIDSDNIEQTIQFNSNLNTIIGGRSTGKSTLLKVLAFKIDNRASTFKDGDTGKEYGFIDSLANNASVEWKDGEIDKSRDIEFFPQSYMHDIARDQDKKDELIKNIIKDTDDQQKLNNYDDFCSQNKDNIQTNIDILFQLQQTINDANLSLKEKGDKTGLKIEIQNINNSISVIKKNDSFSDEDTEKFEEINGCIVELEQRIRALKKDKNYILSFKNEQLFNPSIIHKFNELSDYSKPKVDNILREITEDTTKKWKNALDKELTAINREMEKHTQQIDIKKQQKAFTKGQTHIAENKQYSELSERLKNEQQKLQEITIIERNTQSLSEQKQELFDDTISKHCEYLSKIERIESDFLLSDDDIKIQTKRNFQEKKCKGLLKDFVNLQSHKRQAYVNEFPEKYQDSQQDTIKEFLEKALGNKIELKAYKDIKDLTKGMLVQNWFSISYELTYQNDIFEVMSDGKKAFVILKLLLDFSNKKCPILIDQPEDSLDNRAIYNELVTYIKQKKIERQIILVTHNANIVVNADAEEVIVANQHGNDSKNEKDIKFQYLSGSLENTQAKNNKQVILNSQGIREHVCEVLEGGTDAFKKRENKYGI